MTIPTPGTPEFAQARQLVTQLCQVIDANVEANFIVANDYNFAAALLYMTAAFMFAKRMPATTGLIRLAQCVESIQAEADANQALLTANASLVQFFFDSGRVPSV